MFGPSLLPEANGLLQPMVPLLRCRSALNVNNPEAMEQNASQYASRVDLADRFHGKNKEKIQGEIHVYWLYDDGGKPDLP